MEPQWALRLSLSSRLGAMYGYVLQHDVNMHVICVTSMFSLKLTTS